MIKITSKTVRSLTRENIRINTVKRERRSHLPVLLKGQALAETTGDLNR